MSFKDEQLSKYVNNIFHINEKTAVGKAIDDLRASGKTDDEIRAMNPYYAQELDRRASNINVQDYANKVDDARTAADMAQSLANIHQSDKFDAAAEKAKANVVGAQNSLEDAKIQAKANAEANKATRAAQDTADLEAYNAERKEKAKQALYQRGKDAIAELEQTKKELEQAKKELEELKAKAASGDENAAVEAEKTEAEVEQKEEEVKQDEKELEAAKTEGGLETPANPEQPNPGQPNADNGGQVAPEEQAQAKANAEAEATQDAMKISPTDTPEIQQAKQNFAAEWGDIKNEIGGIQARTKNLMASPAATAYVKQRPDLATKFQKFGGALAAMGTVVGLAGMITMFINPAVGGILAAAGRTMAGVGGATASGANAVTQFKNGNVLGGIGSLAAAGASGMLAANGVKGLSSGIGAMNAANIANAANGTTSGAVATDTATATDPNATVSRDPSLNSTTTPADAPNATPTNGGTTQSFTPGSNPAQFTNREPTIANTNDAVANAHPGDVLQRNDGTRIEINQGDIDWAKAHQAQPAPQVTPQAGAQTVNPGTLTFNQNAGTPNFGNITLPQSPLQPNFLNDYNAYKGQTQPSPLFNSSNNPLNLNLGNIKTPQGVLQPDFLKDYNSFKSQQPVVPPTAQNSIGNHYFSNPKII